VEQVMKVGESVRKAIDDWQLGELDSAMLHACNAVDGSAAKTYPSMPGGNHARFTRFLRDNYYILEPMGAPGINLDATRFPVKVPRPKAPGGSPDLADVIYAIHRCTHGHGDELPDGFELINDVAGPPRLTRLEVEKGKVRISDRMIFALLATAIFTPVNSDQAVPPGYYLTFGENVLPIGQWWGRAADFPALVAKDPMPRVTLVFGDWMDGL
jgi:hypothetical protein